MSFTVTTVTMLLYRYGCHLPLQLLLCCFTVTAAIYRYNCNYVALPLRQPFTVTTVTMLLYPYGCHLPLQLSIPLQMKRKLILSKQKKSFCCTFCCDYNEILNTVIAILLSAFVNALRRKNASRFIHLALVHTVHSIFIQ